VDCTQVQFTGKTRDGEWGYLLNNHLKEARNVDSHTGTISGERKCAWTLTQGTFPQKEETLK
jgi:hypothetical protein